MTVWNALGIRMAAASLVVTAAFLAGCGDDAVAPVCVQVDGECVGVPVEPLCSDGFCTAGVSCARSLGASSDAEIQSRAAEAVAGDCIVLAPGSYATAELPGGVSLLGQGAASVNVGTVRLGDGTGAWIRGIRVTSGLDVGAAKSVRVDAVRIVGGDVGVRASAGSSVHVTRSEIGNTGQYGLAGFDAAVRIDHTLFAATNGPAIWLQCGDGIDGCACPAKPEVSIDHVRVQQHQVVGVSLAGVHATVSHVDIADAREASNFGPTGGLVASGCARLDYDDLFVQNMSSYGVLIHESSAAPVGDLEAAGIIVIDGIQGIWVQGVGAPAEEPNQTVELRRVSVSECSVAGIGFDLEAAGIIVIDGKVSNTRAMDWPVEVGGIANVGFGLIWKDGSSAQIDGLQVVGSAGVGVLIDGPVGEGSSIASLTLGGGDDAEGLVQQQVAAADEAPTTDGTATLEQHPDKIVDVPVGPLVPVEP